MGDWVITAEDGDVFVMADAEFREQCVLLACLRVTPTFLPTQTLWSCAG